MKILATTEARRILHEYIDEMYSMPEGMLIANPDDGFLFEDVCFARKPIKHIIERRKAEGHSASAITKLFDCALKVVADPDFQMPDPNPNHPDGILCCIFFKKLRRGVIVVLDKKIGDTPKVITAYLCRLSDFWRLRRKSSMHLPPGRRRARESGESSH